MPAYCTPADVISFIGDPDADTTVLELLINGVSESVDGHCRRTFEAVTKTISFDWRDPYRLVVDRDLVSVNQVSMNNGDTLSVSDFRLSPASGPPYRVIEIVAPGVTFGWSGTQINAIAVDGVWGYSEQVPNSVKLATIIWVADLYGVRDSRGISSMKASGVSSTTKFLDDKPPGDAAKLLSRYVKRRIEPL